MLRNVRPEAVGISSEKVLSLIKTFDAYGMVTHSLIMARGDNIFTEVYYKPFDINFMHRQYSISKSFIAVAVGLAETEGLLRLDDKIIDYFPEYRNVNTDALYDETSIRDMLTMQSNVTSFVPWYGKFDDRVESYYTQKSTKIPGTMFYYDSVGSYLLGCIVEKLTGKTFLEYLKERVLLKMGFSKDSYTLYAPGGYTMGDSGVICTARDLLIFARFVLNLGRFNGKQYINEEFMRQAISKQSDNDDSGGLSVYNRGYGYLIWKAPDDGFAFLGMGVQNVICDVKHDFVFVINSDNQADPITAKTIIFHELYKSIIYELKDSALPNNDEEYKRLKEYTDNCKLIVQTGEKTSDFAKNINGVSYQLKNNPMQINSFRITLNGETGVFVFNKNGNIMQLEFGIGKNVISEFPEDTRNLLICGNIGKGTYKCASSAAWTQKNKIVIKSQIIDTYFGCLNIHLEFKDSRVTVFMKKSGQYVLDGYNGYAVGEYVAVNL